MKVQHTPGPWTAFYSEHAKRWYIDGPDGTIAQFEMRPTAVEMSHAEMAADARLVAAAPELLAALCDVLEAEVESAGCYCGTVAEVVSRTSDRCAIEAARAAIAKAEATK